MYNRQRFQHYLFTLNLSPNTSGFPPVQCPVVSAEVNKCLVFSPSQTREKQSCGCIFCTQFHNKDRVNIREDRAHYNSRVILGLTSRLDRIGIPSLTFNIMDAAEYRVKGKQRQQEFSNFQHQYCFYFLDP